MVWGYSSIRFDFFSFYSALFTLNFYLVYSPPYIPSVYSPPLFTCLCLFFLLSFFLSHPLIFHFLHYLVSFFVFSSWVGGVHIFSLLPTPLLLYSLVDAFFIVMTYHVVQSLFLTSSLYQFYHMSSSYPSPLASSLPPTYPSSFNPPLNLFWPSPTYFASP